MATTDRTNQNMQIAKMGLSLLGALQEQKRNAETNVPFSFSVGSPKFQFSAGRRPPETDMLKATIEGLEQVRKQREKVFKEQEALDTILQKNQLGQALAQAGLQGQVTLGGEGTQATFAQPKKTLEDSFASALQRQFGPQFVNEPVTAQTPGAVQLPSGGFGVPVGAKNLPIGEDDTSSTTTLKGGEGAMNTVTTRDAQGNIISVKKVPNAPSSGPTPLSQRRGLARKQLSGGGVTAIDLDTQAAIQEINNLAPEKASDTEKKDLANLVNSIESMDGLTNLINTNKEQFEEQLGPLKLSNFTGAIGELARKLKGDPILSTLALETETTFQQVRSAITGAQASAKELEILRPLTPQMTDPINVFIAKTLAFRRVAHRTFQNKLNVLRATGVDTEALEQFNKETLAITESEYKIQLIENGVDPEKADKLVKSFSNKANEISSGDNDFMSLVKSKGATIVG